MKVLLTGVAGFIGSHVCKRLAKEGYHVLGIDNVNDYYDVELKEGRLNSIENDNFHFLKLDIVDKDRLEKAFDEFKPDYVIHLAAQAGVRYSLINPQTYIDSNITGFLNILEACRKFSPKHLIYASSSSVYGLNKKMPFSENHHTDHPKSLYAASKKSNELMAHTYSDLFGIPTTGLRFFTVYGPWGRPDMALFIFTNSIIQGKPIKVFNGGEMRRDFTYIDDIVDGIVRLIPSIPEQNIISDHFNPVPSISSSPYRLFNIGNNKPVNLNYFIEKIEESLGMKAIRENLPMQPGDVEETFADISSLQKMINFQPKTSIEEGIPKFIEWYKDFYKI
jgi:UDP-glucuronate 4-epimerase